MLGASTWSTSRRIFFQGDDDLVTLLAEARLNDTFNESFESAADRKENVLPGSSMKTGRLSTISATSRKSILGGPVRRVERPSETPSKEKRFSVNSRSSLAFNTSNLDDSRMSTGTVDHKPPRRLIQTSLLSTSNAPSPIPVSARAPSLARSPAPFMAQSPYSSRKSSAAASVEVHTPRGGSPSSVVLTSGLRSVKERMPSLNSEPKDTFDYLKVIGKGNFGKVLLARRHGKKDVVAVKVLDRKYLLECRNLRRAHCEIRCLERCSSNFVVKLDQAYETRTNVFIVQEFCAGGELFSVLSRFGKLSNDTTRFYAAQCALALQHLHDLEYAYRDLKTENIMLDRKGNIRLVDFGLVKEGVTFPDIGGKSFVGTTEYLAPEMILRKGHGFAVDWWALGVIIYELLTGLPPWYVKNALEMHRRVVHDVLPLSSPLLHSSAKATISGFLEKDPLKRLGSAGGFEAIKASPYFASVDWVALEEMKIPAPFLPIIEHDTDVRYFSDEFLSLSVEI